jgi:hypothetical protein
MSTRTLVTENQDFRGFSSHSWQMMPWYLDQATIAFFQILTPITSNPPL